MPSNCILINLIYEDVLQKVVVEKAISVCFNEKFSIYNYYPGRGFGWIKNNINAFNYAAKYETFLAVVDLDRDICPLRKIQDWFNYPPNENLLFRIAVKEVESWIIADTLNFSKFLKLRESLLIKNVDNIKDPKQYIFDLIHKSNKRYLKSICPEQNGRIGPDYNEKLSRFVNSSWDPFLAMKNSPSFKRMILRLNEYQPSFD
jgi:hypothetical protein